MQPDQLLVACPNCHAWPMSIHAGKKPRPLATHLVRFTCAKCGYRKERLSGASPERRELEAAPRY
jgi:C4-type Zn-finger protein